MVTLNEASCWKGKAVKTNRVRESSLVKDSNNVVKTCVCEGLNIKLDKHHRFLVCREG